MLLCLCNIYGDLHNFIVVHHRFYPVLKIANSITDQRIRKAQTLGLFLHSLFMLGEAAQILLIVQDRALFLFSCLCMGGIWDNTKILSGYSDHSSFGTFRSVFSTLLLDPTFRPFTNMAGTPRANGRDPLRVTLVGHSFIRRLRDFMNNSLEDNNLRLNREQYYVTCVARGGLTISRLCTLREFTYFVARPNIVFIQIGGNDLCCSVFLISSQEKAI